MGVSDRFKSGLSLLELFTGEKTLCNSAGSIVYDPSSFLVAEIAPDFIAREIVGLLLPVAFAAWPMV